MTIIEPYSTALIYATGAIVTAGLLLGGHKPKQWKVRITPECGVAAGDTVFLPLGDGQEHRAMKVIALQGDRAAMTVDIQDEQHYQAMALTLALAWPVVFPIYILAWLVSRLVKGHPAANTAIKSMQPGPRQRAAAASRSEHNIWTN